MTIFWLRDKLHRDTAPVPFPIFIYRDYFLAVYQTCTATAPVCNKICTMTAKSTPYLSCHRDSYLPKVPGLLRSAQDGRMAASGNTTSLYCRAVMGKPMVQIDKISIGDNRTNSCIQECLIMT